MDDDIRHLYALATQSDSDVICEHSLSVPIDPHFTFGNFSDNLVKQFCSNPYCGPVGLYVAANIGLFERSLLFRGNTVLQCDELRADRSYLTDILPRYHAMSGMIRARKEEGTCVLLLGRGYRVWGHWLVDFLPKLFILKQAGYDLMKLKYLVPENTPDFGIGILDLLGITEERRVVYNQQSEFICPEELLIPTLARTNNRPSPLFKEATRFATSLIWSRHSKPAVRGEMARIFVSRGRLDMKYRRSFLLNREAIERLAAAAGFTVIHPEQVPLLEQFALFSNARQIIGDYGSALHTSIFSDPTTTVCVLRPNSAGFVQSVIADALGQPTGYVFGDPQADDPNGSYTISEDAFENCLMLIFNRTSLTPPISAPFRTSMG